jgi:hypothetical protein
VGLGGIARREVNLDEDFMSQQVAGIFIEELLQKRPGCLQVALLQQATREGQQDLHLGRILCIPRLSRVLRIHHHP